MKRLIFSLVLAVLVCTSLFAGPLDLTGQLIFAVTSDGNVTNTWYSEAWMQLTEQVTEATSFVANMETAYRFGGSGDAMPFSPYFEEFYVKSNLSKVFGINPDLVNVEVRFGLCDIDATTYTFTDYAYENIGDVGQSSVPSIIANIGLLKNYAVALWFNPMGPGPRNYETNPPRFGINPTFVFGPIKTSVYYYSNGALKLADGRLGASIGFNQDILGLTWAGEVEAICTPSTPDDYTWGACLSGGYKNWVNLVTDFGANKDGIQKIAFEVNSAPIQHLSILCGTAFAKQPDQSFKHDNTELGGKIAWDAWMVKFGVILTDTGAAAGSMYASQVPVNDWGAVWAKFYLNF